MSQHGTTVLIVEGCGQHFDPDIVAGLCAVEQEFRAIAASYCDADGAGDEQ